MKLSELKFFIYSINPIPLSQVVLFSKNSLFPEISGTPDWIYYVLKEDVLGTVYQSVNTKLMKNHSPLNNKVLHRIK